MLNTSVCPLMNSRIYLPTGNPVSTNVDIAEALQILGEQTDNEMLRLALVEIRDEVRQGKSLSSAMRAHPKISTNCTSLW